MSIIDVRAYFGKVQVLNLSNQGEHFREKNVLKTERKKSTIFDVRLVASNGEAIRHADKENRGFISLGLFDRCFARYAYLLSQSAAIHLEYESYDCLIHNYLPQAKQRPLGIRT